MKKNIFFFCLILLSSSICFSQEQTDYPKYILYLPKGVQTTQAYPLVMALSPSADAQGMINLWSPAADKFKWIILASKEFKNGIDMNQSLAGLADSFKAVCGQFPVDKAKIIITGFSGGAMGAHAFSYTYPSMVSAIIVNTGMINDYYLEKKSNYPRHKIAAFLASPTDFRYKEMKRDKEAMDSLGWITKWIEFDGGHRLAPLPVYLEAANWINELWRGAEKSEKDNRVASKSVLAAFKIDGIIFNPKGKSSVIINGEILQEGERFRGALIVKIREDSVILIIDGQPHTLRWQ
ncbi:MAG: hypothetical protein WC412_00485 [Candidatus Omnitrophota bacterium]|jgi:predicted esterase